MNFQNLKAIPACQQAQKASLYCRYNFEPGSRLILAGTIQFASSIQLAKQQLAADYPSLVIPQSKPLSPGDTVDIQRQNASYCMLHSNTRIECNLQIFIVQQSACVHRARLAMRKTSRQTACAVLCDTRPCGTAHPFYSSVVPK